MGSDAFFRWLFGEAGAGWVFGIVSAAVLLYSFLRKPRPRRLVFKELTRGSLVRIRPEVTDKIQISFDDAPVASLAHLKAEIYNEGGEAIHDPEIAVRFPDETRLLALSITCSVGDFPFRTEVDGNEATIGCPYLNPAREHNHRFEVTFLLDGKTEGVSVSGGGEGWSVRHARMPTFAQQQSKTILWVVVGMLLVIATYPYGTIIEARFGIDPLEISARALVAYTPILASIGAWAYLGARQFLGTLRRLL